MRNKHILLSLTVCLVTCTVFGCRKTKPAAEPTQAASKAESAAPAEGAEPDRSADRAKAPVAGAKQVKMVTNKGAITIELFGDKAPKSVANFLQYVQDRFYDGTVFHRVIDGFMVQGGGFDATLNQKSTRNPVENEADNGLKNARGTLAMARTSDPHSATAQFFINLKDNDFLDFTAKSPSGWGYTVFGKVTSGMDAVDAIAKVPTGGKGPFPRDVPQEDIVIESIRVVE